MAETAVTRQTVITKEITPQFSVSATILNNKIILVAGKNIELTYDQFLSLAEFAAKVKEEYLVQNPPEVIPPINEEAE